MGDSNSAPDRYGVMGHPIDHSWSPFIHGLFAKQTGQNLSYRLFDVTPEKFRSGALEFFTHGGADSTSPCRTRARRPSW